MGLAIRDLLKFSEIEIGSLTGKTVAIDAFNLLYQFLTTIRQQDGSLLTDSKGRVTSHLTGLFARTANLLQKGVQPAFVFDGKAPELKTAERDRRRVIKQEAQTEYDVAKDRGDIESMKKYAGRTSRLTEEMIADAKSIITSMGCPVIDAPSEGEAQAAYMAKKGDVYATVSQDFDTLLHGTPRLVRNLSIAGKRKKTARLGMVTVKPELVVLSENLNNLGIDNDQLIILAILVGTDYNIGGVKGIGPKKAIDLVKKYGKDFDELFKEIDWTFDVPWTDIFYLIKQIPTTDNYTLAWEKPDVKSLRALLVDEYEFSADRINKTLDKFDDRGQKGLGDFI